MLYAMHLRVARVLISIGYYVLSLIVVPLGEQKLLTLQLLLKTTVTMMRRWISTTSQKRNIEQMRSDLDIKHSSKKTAVWRIFLKTKRRHLQKTYFFAMCRLGIMPALSKRTFIGVLNTTNMRNHFIREHNNEIVVDIVSDQKVNVGNNVCVI